MGMPGRRRSRRQSNKDSGSREGPSRTQVTVSDLQDLFDKRKLSADQWKELGTRLGLEPGILNEIQSDNAGKPNSSRMCLLEMLDAWLKIESAGEDATLNKFKKALR